MTDVARNGRNPKANSKVIAVATTIPASAANTKPSTFDVLFIKKPPFYNIGKIPAILYERRGEVGE